MSKTVFLFGNGVSRKEFDISSLEGRGLIIGCNWAYKDYPFDIICSSDPEVSRLINKEWDKDWIRRDNKKSVDSVYFNTHSPKDLICELPQLSGGTGWDTGRTAIYSISKKYKPETLYIFGFDIDSTNMYPMSNLETKISDGLISGWNTLFGLAKDMGVNVVRVGPIGDLGNKLVISQMTYEEFENE